MKTKGQRKAEDRKRLRKAKSWDRDIHRDIMLGKCCRRGWGSGMVK